MKVLSNLPLSLEPPFVNRSFVDYIPELSRQILRSAGLKYTSLQNVLAKIPPSEKPDIVAIGSPEYLPVPEDIGSFGGLKILFITDWNVCTRFLKDLCPLFDFCFTDLAGTQMLRSWSLTNIYHQPLFGHHPSVYRLINPLETKEQFANRPYDISFCGSLNTGLHYRRNQFLYKLIESTSNFNLYIGQDHGKEYIEVLNKSKLVWNYAIRQEANMRVFESMACGAIPLIEETNLEVPVIFREGENYFSYQDSNLEDVIASALSNPNKLWTMRSNGLAAAANNTRSHQYTQALKFVVESGRKVTAQITPSDKSLPTLIKLNVLGLGYHGVEILDQLKVWTRQFPHLLPEMVPGLFLQYFKDARDKNENNAGIEAYLQKNIMEKNVLPSPMENFFATQWHGWGGHWDKVLATGSQCYRELKGLCAASNRVDREKLYAYLVPPLRLGDAMTNDLNRCFKDDMKSGDFLKIIQLLMDQTISLLIQAELSMQNVESAINWVKLISSESFYSVPKYLWEARVYEKSNDWNRMVVAFRDLFQQEPMNYDHWGVILKGCQSADRMDLWNYYYNKFLDLTKKVYHQNKDLLKAFEKGESRDLY